LEQALLARRAARLSANVAATGHGSAISFDSGHAFPGVLPNLTEFADRALSTHRAETLQYAPRFGLPELREWVAEYMTGDGVKGMSADNVLVVNGAKHGLELVCRLLLDEGDAVVVTAPTYFTAIPIFKSFGVEFIEVSQDADGLHVEELRGVLEERRRAGRAMPKFIYDVPDFHNPSGVTMSRSRREALIELTSRFGMFIVEDSPYRKVRFEGESEPPIKALDGTTDGGRVLMLGTFSKLLAPGLRIGWVAGPAEMLARMALLKSDAGSCPLTQRIIIEFCGAGQLPVHIKRVQETYRAHRDRMVAAMRRDFPEARFSVPHGGYYLWLTLPEGCDGDELFRAAEREGVIVVPGSKFFASSGGSGGTGGGKAAPKNHIRAAYSHANLEEIDEGVKRLARAFRSICQAKPAVRA
jgi:2-aminoadipate transaminase